MRTADEYAAAARENFLAGYNCAQSVLLAFAGEIGETPERALRLASPLGAGMGRLRQVCGALSAAFLVEGALRGYKEINLRAMKMLPEGGFLVTCSCSQHVSRQAFEDMLLSAARDAHRLVRVVEARTQGRDHPVLLAAPETQYLKFFVLQVF